MAQETVYFNGDERVFSTKKKMLMQIGYEILSESDHAMTLRQLYYRFVAHDIIENKQSQYQYLSKAIMDARIDGLIPWSWIEDLERDTDAGDDNMTTPRGRFNWLLDWFKEGPERYRLPRWLYQPNYVEVWVEKKALSGIFGRACRDVKVMSVPSKGYSSITMLNDAAERFRDEAEKDYVEDLYILYFGDFDPSGKDIERNIRDKLRGTFGIDVTVERHALTYEQIEERQLPPQPAKKTDARFEDFAAEHGDMAVELDALEPTELTSMIKTGVESYFDQQVYEDRVVPRQEKEASELGKMIDGALCDEDDGA